ncbi:alpha 1,3-fucosyl transferase [Helicobacter pylori Hp A-16]|nr:alpha 1,3-fucosyl transferase [Helicobacter pylori Hp A-16]
MNNESDPLKRGFASFVASNPNAPIRNAFYDALNSIEPVAGGGSVKNTLGYNVKNKSEFLSQYKFNLCFENTQGYGYVTEKSLTPTLATPFLFIGGVLAWQKTLTLRVL